MSDESQPPSEISRKEDTNMETSPQLKQGELTVTRELLVELRRATIRQGPLPSPEEFGGYDQVLPGAAERILSMAEKEQKHRHDLESQETEQAIAVSKSEIGLAANGQRIAAVLFLSIIVGGLALGFLDKVGPSVTALLVGVIGEIAVVFGNIWNQRKRASADEAAND
jgi:uncharacterized membrane protein